MPKIVNLSSCHTLHPISTGIEAFVRLCDKYSKGGCCGACPSIFTKLTNKAWVRYLYGINLNTLINPYRLGKISTEQFFAGMLRMFNFLDNDMLVFSSEDVNRIRSNQDGFVSIRDVQHLSNRHIALALLEEAWNAIIAFSEGDADKFDYLFEQSLDTPIYLISNTNELNVYSILYALREKFPQVKWQDVDLSVDVDNHQEEFLEIAPNIFLCLSYKAHAFKTDAENSALKATTPSLLRYLVSKLDVELSDIEVVSQYDKDLKEALRLGIPQENLQTAEAYFPTFAKALRYRA